MKTVKITGLVMVGIMAVTLHAQAACVDLSTDLSLGMSDSGTNHSVLNLQTYLKSVGYLSAIPNGHFGPATEAGVKIYQTINNISSTGKVGPLTRASIDQKSCPVSTAATVIPTQTPTTSNQINTPVVTTTGGVTSPSVGQVLSIGSTTVIRWNTAPSNTFNISLEQPGGAGAGFIATSQSTLTNSNQYTWNVGKIFSSQTNSYQTVPDGTYRIRIQDASAGAASTDQTSGWFTIVASTFAISSVTPSSAYADNTTSVVLLGTGFTSSASVYFDSNYSSLRGNNEYVSPDGTVLVFTVPTNVPAGPHTLFINNGQSATPATVSFSVNSVN